MAMSGAAAAALVVATSSAAAAHEERETIAPDGKGSVPVYRTAGPALLVCKQDKADFDSRIACGDTLLELGDAAGAEEQWQRAKACWPSCTEQATSPELRLARLYRDQGEQTKAQMEMKTYCKRTARAFTPRLHTLLRTRRDRQARLDAGTEKLAFRSDAASASVRAGDWRVGEIPRDLLDRRVEITGPAEAKMILNALGSGAQVFMADFEDSLSPTWPKTSTTLPG